MFHATSTEAHEWEAFLALLPLFGGAAYPASVYDRSLGAVQRRQGEYLTRAALVTEAGLGFFEHSFDIDLALMQLVRECRLTPVREPPFTFYAPRKENDRASDIPQSRPPILAYGSRRL